MDDKDENRISFEILHFIEDQNGVSYYELLEYAYNHDMYEWVQYIKGKGRYFVPAYLRSKHKSDKVKYRRDFLTNFYEYLEAGARYYKRLDKKKNKELFDKLESM